MITRLFKWLFVLSLLLFIGASIWVVFAVWTGLYSVYSYPPSKEHPDGATLIISRMEGEPMFNSPDYKPPKQAPPSEKKGGVGFGSSRIKSFRPVTLRTIVSLPYIDWAYRQSVEPSGPSPTKK
jgi:hypothetical protein